MRILVLAAILNLSAFPALAQTAPPTVSPSSQGMMPNGAPTAPPAAGTGMNPTATGRPIIPTTPVAPAPATAANPATPDCNQVTNAQGNPAPAHALACNTETNPPLRPVTPPH